jgi:uncharacterized membrane protein YsdA (DUF1294 family)
MPLPLIALAAAGSFACLNPSHHDGDNLRCSNMPGSMRLQGIDAPEMPGGCRPGRTCVDGDPFAARDYLRGLTAGKLLQCVQEDTDAYDRRIVNCSAGGVNISCAMIASGHAVARYAPLDCGAQDALASTPAARAPVPGEPAEPARIVPADMVSPARSGLTLLLPPLLALLLINAVTWALFAIDKRRAVARRSRDRIAERTLLGWAALGGSPAAWHAITTLRHKSSKDAFRLRLMLISGVQTGMVIGLLWWWFGS